MSQAKTIMVVGTASGVGKSMVATGLCRLLHQNGHHVAPFKAKNISNNSGVTLNGEEMGIAQIVQAKAAGTIPLIEMNPVLVKSERDGGQLIVNGKIAGKHELEEYKRDRLLSIAASALDRLRYQFDVIVMEGAGSAAEPNFMPYDIANLLVAKHAGTPIILVSDIERGGVFGWLEGTISIIRRLDPVAAKLVKGFVINKSYAKKEDLAVAIDDLVKVTGIPVLGVLPYMKDHGISEEDVFDVQPIIADTDAVNVVVIKTPSVQNVQDFDVLRGMSGVQVRFITDAKDFGNPDLVVLPGSKQVVRDLQWIREHGFVELIGRHVEAGNSLIGICGGYQMLGERICDPNRVESEVVEIHGLGLLPVVTTFASEKITRQVTGRILVERGLLQGGEGLKFSGYEIHMGRSQSNANNFAQLTASGGEEAFSDGAISADGQIFGTYVHDVLADPKLARLIINNIARQKDKPLVEADTLSSNQKYDALANVMRQNIDMALLNEIIGL